ncbi:MAG TPA: secondary thiamine-phosphate synthase enzyme YjbQ [Deltaproteobacteria bacterium]|nr:secondary thiamine-phosphate synthase enzyme YjbQ [Deltaproteobacteria bacterium]
MRFTITFPTHERQELVDITDRVRAIVSEHGAGRRLCALYAMGATAAIMIQENWDPNIPSDVIACLNRIVPKGIWLHDRVDGNGDAHIKAGIIGPSEVIPIDGYRLMLSTWQNVFFCEFDGPRARREVLVTLV